MDALRDRPRLSFILRLWLYPAVLIGVWLAVLTYTAAGLNTVLPSLQRIAAAEPHKPPHNRAGRR
jgi:hypothetical protein